MERSNAASAHLRPRALVFVVKAGDFLLGPQILERMCREILTAVSFVVLAPRTGTLRTTRGTASSDSSTAFGPIIPEISARFFHFAVVLTQISMPLLKLLPFSYLAPIADLFRQLNTIHHLGISRRMLRPFLRTLGALFPGL